ncbi:MAG: ABC transporter ATP-binding protein [Spirochaetota bacterium]
MTVDGPFKVRCTDVARRYTDGGETITALEGFTATFTAGESVAVTGPSGSGKSTLLALLAAIDYADEGTIYVGDVELGSLSTIEQATFRANRVAYLYPEHNLLPMLSVYENITLALSLRRLAEADLDLHARTALNRLEIGDIAHRRPATLSSGERSRAALARAIAGETQLLVADEPTAHLDLENSRMVARLLADLAADGSRLVVVATHDPTVAGFATRTVRLRTADGE